MVTIHRGLHEKPRFSDWILSLIDCLKGNKRAESIETNKYPPHSRRGLQISAARKNKFRYSIALSENLLGQTKNSNLRFFRGLDSFEALLHKSIFQDHGA